jgi:hypothetical protein
MTRVTALEVSICESVGGGDDQAIVAAKKRTALSITILNATDLSSDRFLASI